MTRMTHMPPDIAAKIHAGVDRLGLNLPGGAEAQFAAYLALLAKWNRVYNLTAVRDASQMVTQHLLDSLAVLPHLGSFASLADVGSGGGLPGIPLAIARPAMAVTLIEANQKKATFLQQAKIELKLDNVSIHYGRVEDLKPLSPFGAVISRAFSDLALFVEVAGHLLAPGAPLLAMKGVQPQEEIARLPDDWRVTSSIPIVVPGLDAQRHLITIEKK